MINNVYLDTHQLLHITVAGDQTEASVQEMGEKVGHYIRQLRANDQPVLVLDNLKHLGRTTSEARREVARLARTLDFDRAAMVGDGTLVMRYGTNLMLRAIGRSNVKYFSSLDAAQTWLCAYVAAKV